MYSYLKQYFCSKSFRHKIDNNKRYTHGTIIPLLAPFKIQNNIYKYLNQNHRSLIICIIFFFEVWLKIVVIFRYQTYVQNSVWKAPNLSICLWSETGMKMYKYEVYILFALFIMHLTYIIFCFYRHKQRKLDQCKWRRTNIKPKITGKDRNFVIREHKDKVNSEKNLSFSGIQFLNDTNISPTVNPFIWYDPWLKSYLFIV